MNDTDASAMYSFNHPAFTQETEGVQYFAAKRITVLIGGGTDRLLRKVCQITFHKGSIFVQFTYFGEAKGLVAAVEPVEGPPGTWQMNLGASGVVAPSLVKYSHPPDGMAHFSQDGKLITSVRRQSFPLATGQGHVFELDAFLPTRFESLEPGSERSDRLYTPFFFQAGIPSAIGVVGMWWPFSRLVGIRPSDDTAFGPLAHLINRRTQKRFLAFFAAPPQPNPPTNVLLVNVGPTPLPTGVSKPLLTFMGGWDPDVERKAEPGGCLTFIYPIEDPEAWASRQGTLEYRPSGIDPAPAS